MDRMTPEETTLNLPLEKTTNADVTVWFRALEQGDQTSAVRLWDYCFPRLLRFSKSRLPPNLRRALDEEDVALSAFKSLCTGAKDGSLQTVKDRDELWKLLACITARKAQGYIKHETRKKRGGGKVRGESIFVTGASAADAGGASKTDGIDQQAGNAETPAMLSEFADECQKMLSSLGDDMLQTIALLRIEGYSVQEIADRLGCAKRSVERRLQLIRKIWTEA